MLLFILQLLACILSFIMVGYAIYSIGNTRGYLEGHRHGITLGRAMKAAELKHAQEEARDEETEISTPLP